MPAFSLDLKAGIPNPSTCTSGSQAIMIAGDTEELCPSEAAVFDTLFAASQLNDTPEQTPTPFNQHRDGLVIGAGAATLVLEELQHALVRGATIYAELIGFATNCDASQITQLQQSTMRICIEQALASSEVGANAIGYISAHGNATERGGIAESHATTAVFGNHTPISSLTSYFGLP